MARLLSPTAVRDTGPLQQFGTLQDSELSPMSEVPGSTPNFGRTASATSIAMPTDIVVDGTVPQASGDVDFTANDNDWESSLTSSPMSGLLCVYSRVID